MKKSARLAMTLGTSAVIVSGVFATPGATAETGSAGKPVVAAPLLGFPAAAQANSLPSTVLRSKAGSGKCVGLANRGSTANGTPLVIWDCHFHPDQIWQGNNDRSIRTLAGSGKCVGLANNGSTANGTPLVIWDCHLHPDQQWRFAALGANTYSIRSFAASTAKCVGLANNGSTANGTPLVIWDCHFHPDQQWNLPESPAAFGFAS
ncbi:RICIN domain-containing protein [Nonomuraea sp. NEAU-A123]|uniref:RICIN domain-containing protein n=1 Tax=Nonomuraea sp. NEAU-A123 TaxID=2839649 RepID=UPI001BE4603C|nr:RICIN domain-containing protein [Nonomuraea sp. NEAU-A123]MBT2232146.1 RICIN domain-containing protein [Nonomuraea sp. NEAU-A123]